MRRIVLVAALVCLPVLAKAKDDYPPEGDFSKYAKLTTDTYHQASANKDCAAYDQAMSYWLKAYNEAVTHLHAMKNYLQHELSTVRNPGNPHIVQGTRDIYEGLLHEELSMINWAQYKYYILYEPLKKAARRNLLMKGQRNEKGCTRREGTRRTLPSCGAIASKEQRPRQQRMTQEQTAPSTPHEARVWSVQLYWS